jgi:hypothetical protein
MRRMSAQIAGRSTLVLAAGLLLPCPADAQSPPTLLDSYARAITLLNYMTAYVGESLLACAEKNALTEAQAETRFKAYRVRNAMLLERAETWNQEAEKRLRAQGEDRAAQRRAEEAGMSAVAEASMRAQGEIGNARDVGALCAARSAAIEAGSYDLSSNAEFVNLLKANP